LIFSMAFSFSCCVIGFTISSGRWYAFFNVDRYKTRWPNQGIDKLRAHMNWCSLMVCNLEKETVN
jgi:hypothetical protein